MNTLTLEGAQDFALTTDALNFMQNSYKALESLALLGGENYILSGCKVTGSSVASGIVVINGKIMPFEGGTIQADVKVVKTTSTVTVGGTSREEITYKAQFGTSLNPSDNVAWSAMKSFDELVKITSRMDAVEDITDKIKHSNKDISIQSHSSSAGVVKDYCKIGRSQSLWSLNCKFTFQIGGQATNPEFSFGEAIPSLSYRPTFFVNCNGAVKEAEVMSVTPLRIKIYHSFAIGNNIISINQTFAE